MKRSARLLLAIGTFTLAGCSGNCCPRPCPCPCAPSPCGVPAGVPAVAAAPTAVAAVAAAIAGARVPLDRAIEAALAAKPGLAIEAGYESETVKGVKTTVVEVMVLDANGAAIEVQVDAGGKVVSATASDEADETAELQAVAQRMPKDHLSLAELVRRASKYGATQVMAAFQSEKGRPAVFVVAWKSGADTMGIVLDPVTGAVRDGPRKVEEEDDDEKDEKSEKSEKGAHEGKPDKR